jgi:hypothetical protein
MTFQTTWTRTREKELPNRLRKNPTISLRLNLSPEAHKYLTTKTKNNKRTEFILKAIESRVFFKTKKGCFLKQMLEEDYDLCKYLLRKIGGRRNFR